jgi:MHS family proline/betaine transporter-like MFS transporter
MTSSAEFISVRRRVLAGIAGNVMEWYDFAVYGFFASIIAEQYFPSDDPSVSLIAAFGAFAAGFLMRPVGAVLFGHVGDRFGRVRALQLSVVCMAIPTFIIGLLPTYQSIGISAAVLMVLMRMFQGTAVGGEYTCSIVYLAEEAPHNRRGFFTSWSMFGATGGILVGSGVGALLSGVMSPDALSDWGWRLAFLSGILVSVSAYFIRRGMGEALDQKHLRAPLVEAFREHGRDMFRIVGVNIAAAVTFYLIFVYVVTWLNKNVGQSREQALDINTLSMLLLLLLTPLLARLSDAWGRKRQILTGLGALILFTWPLLQLMHHQDSMRSLAGQFGMVIIVALFISPVPAMMTETFPRRIRATAVSVSYNITYALFGGTSPMVAVWLIEREHDDLAFSWFIIGAAVLSFLVALTLTDRSRLPLE